MGLAGGLLGVTPAPVQALVGPVASLLPITPFNLVCTNVRGPETPLYLLGHKMLDWYPYVPVGGEMALNCAMLSYNGMTYFGFSGDVHAAPDLNQLESLLELNFRELQRAAGIRPPHGNKARIQRKPVAVHQPRVRVASPIAPETPAASIEVDRVKEPEAKTEQVSFAVAAD